MQPEATPNSEKLNASYMHNHDAMLSVLRGTDGPIVPQKKEPDLSVCLERVLVDRATNMVVAYEGENGIEQLLKNIADAWKGLTLVYEDNRLIGLEGRLIITQNQLVGIKVSLCAGGQIACAAGPSSSIFALLRVIESFDLQVHAVSRAMGCDYELVAEGYNSYVSSPLDVQLVPRAQWTLLTAHLSQKGRYARDALRCECATSISLVHGGDRASIASFRLATALSPLLNFLCDNVRCFRGTDARHTQRMIRSVLWEEVDPARCGVVPGTFENDFSFERYLNWVEEIQPIMFEGDDGSVVSTGKQTLKEHMSSQSYSHNEAARMLYRVFPYARLLEHTLQISQADSMRPHLVGGYLAFMKGLFRNELTVDNALSCFGVLGESDVTDAARELRKNGWDAKVYGRDVAELVDQLIRLSRSALSSSKEQLLLNQLAELWEVRMVPRDAFVRQEIRQIRGW